MQEKSLESTAIFKIFWGEHTPVPLASRTFGARPFRSNHFMSPNLLQWNPATGLSSIPKKSKQTTCTCNLTSIDQGMCINCNMSTYM